LVELSTNINNEIKKVYKWFNENGLTLNISKTNTMTFFCKEEIQVKLEETPLANCATTKYLGVTFDKYLKFREHATAVVSKINSATFMLRRTGNCLLAASRKLIYNSLIETHLLYAALVWQPLLQKKDRIKLDICQKKAVRAITGARWQDHAEPIFKSQGLLKRGCLIKRLSLLMVKNWHCNKLPTEIQGLFKMAGRKTRQKNNVVSINNQGGAHEMATLWNLNRDLWDIKASHIKNIITKNLLGNYYSICTLVGCHCRRHI
jgi:hypothetical protein